MDHITRVWENKGYGKSLQRAEPGWGVDGTTLSHTPLFEWELCEVVFTNLFLEYPIHEMG